MTSRAARRVPAHGRRAPRIPRVRIKRFLVIGGGAVTEREYFDHLGRAYGVKIEYQQKNNSPSQLAKYAARRKKDADSDGTVDAYEGVWVVVDVDEFHDHRAAQRICDENGIELIISNPCFEVWLIDHIQICPSSYTTTRDVERYALQAGVTEGARGKYINFEKIDGHIDTAIMNAKRHNTEMRQQGRKDLIDNREQSYAPWTDMVAVEQILEASPFSSGAESR